MSPQNLPESPTRHRSPPKNSSPLFRGHIPNGAMERTGLSSDSPAHMFFWCHFWGGHGSLEPVSHSSKCHPKMAGNLGEINVGVRKLFGTPQKREPRYQLIPQACRIWLTAVSFPRTPFSEGAPLLIPPVEHILGCIWGSASVPHFLKGHPIARHPRSTSFGVHLFYPGNPSYIAP